VSSVLWFRRKEGIRIIDRFCEFVVPTVRYLPPLIYTVNNALFYNIPSLYSILLHFLYFKMHWTIYHTVKNRFLCIYIDFLFSYVV
jgi:hypothetical protein